VPKYLKYLLKADKWLYPNTGVSDADSLKDEWACDNADGDADDLLDELGLNKHNLSELQLRDFLEQYINQHPEFSDLYSPESVIPQSQSRAFPKEGWGGNAPVLIPPSADY